MSSKQAISKLNQYGNRTWMKMGDLEIDKPHKIIVAIRVPSKYYVNTMQTAVQLENGYIITLPSRFNDLSDDMFEHLQTGVYMINKGPNGKTWKIIFTDGLLV